MAFTPSPLALRTHALLLLLVACSSPAPRPAAEDGAVRTPARPEPREVPAEFQEVLPTLRETGIPPLLPPRFPGEDGLPPIHPHLLTASQGEYELSLDYGAECQGAGACRFGSLMARRNDSRRPLGTASFPFEAEQAQPVALARGLEGHFVDFACGASCGDAMLFWTWEGYEYMVGIKAGARVQVIALANAAIENSIP